MKGFPFACVRLAVHRRPKQRVREVKPPGTNFHDLHVLCGPQQIVRTEPERPVDRDWRRVGQRGDNAKRVNRGERQGRHTLANELA